MAAHPSTSSSPPLAIQALHHIAVICSDIGRSRAFYTRILGLRIIAETPRPERGSVKIDLAIPGGGQVELFSFPTPPPRPTHPEACGLRHLAFAIADLDAAVARLHAHGIAVEPVRTDGLTGLRFTFFRDPDDLPIELYETTRRAE